MSADDPDKDLERVLAALATAKDFAIVLITQQGGELTYHTENASGKLKSAVTGCARKIRHRRTEGPRVE